MKFIAVASTAIAFALATGLGACAPKNSVSTLPSNQAGQVVPVQFGTIMAIEAVNIRPGQTRLGMISGAVLGGAAGSQIGNSTSSSIAGAAAGAVAGGAVGSGAQGASRTGGMELTLRLDSGATVAILQPGNPNDFRVGDRVRLTGTAQNARVTR